MDGSGGVPAGPLNSSLHTSGHAEGPGSGARRLRSVAVMRWPVCRPKYQKRRPRPVLQFCARGKRRPKVKAESDPFTGVADNAVAWPTRLGSAVAEPGAGRTTASETLFLILNRYGEPVKSSTNFGAHFRSAREAAVAIPGPKAGSTTRSAARQTYTRSGAARRPANAI